MRPMSCITAVSLSLSAGLSASPRQPSLIPSERNPVPDTSTKAIHHEGEGVGTGGEGMGAESKGRGWGVELNVSMQY